MWPTLGEALGDADQCLFWTPASCVQVDVNDFKAACQTPDLDRVSALYTGDLLPDCYDEWVLVQRHHIQSLFLSALELRIARLARDGQYAAAVLDVHRHLTLDPLREDIYRLLMRLLARQGDRAGALHAYQTLTQLLQRELGVMPSRPTQRLYDRLLNDDPSLAANTWSRDEQFA